MHSAVYQHATPQSDTYIGPRRLPLGDLAQCLRQITVASKEQNCRSTEIVLVALIVAYILCDISVPVQTGEAGWHRKPA